MSSQRDHATSDWTFQPVADFEAQIDPHLHAGGLSLFHFSSRAARRGSYVLFAGAGIGGGIRFSLNNRDLHILLDTVDKVARPSLGGPVKVSLPRSRADTFALNTLTVSRPFSLDDLHGASGRIGVGGVGVGVGFGAVFASASNGGSALFQCRRLGVEFGRVGAGASALTGMWLVGCKWDE